MTRGTTPTHYFTLPVDETLVKSIRIIYLRENGEKLIKTKPDCKLSGKTASLKLTQAETLSFLEGEQVEVQMRVLTTGNDAPASKIKKFKVERLLEDVEIV